MAVQNISDVSHTLTILEDGELKKISQQIINILNLFIK